MSEWKPIETAPANGEQFLAAVKIGSGWVFHVCYRWEGGPLIAWADMEASKTFDTATHWMPLPNPPIKS